MKWAFEATVLAVLLVIPGTCFALWGLLPVSRERAKELDMLVRATPAGPNHVVVELEFKTEGPFKEFGPDGPMREYSRVDLRVGGGDNPPVTAPLREDRTKPGQVVVRFTADRGHLDRLDLWVMVPAPLGGTAYCLRVKDFVEIKEAR